MLRKMSVIILLILTALWVTNSDSIRPAREFIQNNIYVWSETQEEKLPIYCVDTDKKQIALTFDTAWGNEDIPQILKILKQENVKATFFFCGDWISKYPADIKTIYEEGHDIASHGDHHKYMTKLTDKQQQEEILRTDAPIDEGQHQDRKTREHEDHQMRERRREFSDHNVDRADLCRKHQLQRVAFPLPADAGRRQRRHDEHQHHKLQGSHKRVEL